MYMDVLVDAIIGELKELNEDTTVPRNIKQRLVTTIEILQEQRDFSTKKNRALNELEEVADDTNLQPYPRTRVYAIISKLETTD